MVYHLPPPLTIGSLELESPVIFSPLAGCSDVPFREMCRKYSKSLMYCEMVKMDPLVRGDRNTFHLLDYSDQMHPIGAQICGSKPELAAPCARLIEDLGFDVIDLNCGCPVDKVTKDGSGSGLLRHPEKIGEILANMTSAVSIPVTVKIRAGWDHDSINALDIVRIAEEAGAQLIAIHGRTRSQAYRGTANRDIIQEAKQAARTIKVAGNGDIFDVESALHMFSHTGCDAILLSRGGMGAPWLAADILAALAGEPLPERNPKQSLDEFLAHLEHITHYRHDRRAALDIRRVGPWYCGQLHGVSELRKQLARTKCPQEARRLVVDFAN